MKQRASFSLLVILALLVFFVYKRWQEPPQRELFDRTPAQLVYTKHALCRMDCRRISKQDVMEIMDEGIINLGKSDRQDKPCPTFALQGTTTDGEKLRIVFAQCNDVTRVVTCINLEEDFECHCPCDPAPAKKQQRPL